MRTCEHCSVPFQLSRGSRPNARFCSDPCARHAQGVRVERSCAQCDRAFLVPPSIAKRGRSGQAYCSRGCYFEANRRPMKTLTCAGCGKSFARRAADLNGDKFCSRTCRKILATVSRCPRCDKEFRVTGYRRIRGQVFCSRTCANAAMTKRAEAKCERCGVSFARSLSRAARFCSGECAHPTAATLAGAQLTIGQIATIAGCTRETIASRFKRGEAVYGAEAPARLFRPSQGKLKVSRTVRGKVQRLLEQGRLSKTEIARLCNVSKSFVSKVGYS